MLIDLFEWLNRFIGHFPGAGLFQYITFRAGLAVIFSLLISLVFGGAIINYLIGKSPDGTSERYGAQIITVTEVQ